MHNAMHILLRQNGPDIAWTPCIPSVALNLLPNGLTSAVRFATARLKEKDKERDRVGRMEVIKKVELR